MGATHSPLIKDWEIQIDTWPRKIIAIALVLAVCGTLIYRTWWLFLAAWITRNKPSDPAVYELAAKYDPKNAEYHFTLALIYNYSTIYLNTKRAGEEFEKSVELNPFKADQWREISKYYEQQGMPGKARDAMKKALERDPNYAQTHWSAANLYIRLDDLKAADYELRRTADLDVTYLPQVLDLLWRFYEDPDRIMSVDVPNSKDSNLTALNYFIGQKSEHGAAVAWTKLNTFETRPEERFGYIDYLVSLGKPHEAWDVFSFPGKPALLFNASFETDPLNGGFDWRFASTEHAESRRDTTTAKDGLASWLVAFDGKENVDYGGLWHWIPTTRGRQYALSFWMKTEAISTNEGVFVEVDGQTSEKQLGTTYWQQFTIPFTASSDLVSVRLRRSPSRKLDNQLKGKVWLDAFEVVEK